MMLDGRWKSWCASNMLYAPLRRVATWGQMEHPPSQPWFHTKLIPLSGFQISGSDHRKEVERKVQSPPKDRNKIQSNPSWRIYLRRPMLVLTVFSLIEGHAFYGNGLRTSHAFALYLRKKHALLLEKIRYFAYSLQMLMPLISRDLQAG